MQLLKQLYLIILEALLKIPMTLIHLILFLNCCNLAVPKSQKNNSTPSNLEIMKSLIKDIAIIALLVGLILWGCSKSVLIDIDNRIVTKVDTVVVVKADTPETQDTARTPISFEVTIEPWPDEI